MPITSPYHGKKGPTTDIVMRSLDRLNEPPIVLSTPNEITLNKGVTLTELMSANQLGEMVLVDQFTNENRPSLSLTFPTQNPETVGLREGYKPRTATETRETWVARGPISFAKQSIPSGTNSDEGVGVVADPFGALASYLDDSGISQPITIGTYAAGVPPASPASIAIGVDFALEISEDLLGKYLTIYCPNNLAGITYLSEADIQENFQIDVSFVTRPNLRVGHIRFYKALLNPSSGDINLGAESNIQVDYSIVPDGAHCKLYEWEWLPQNRVCK